MFRFKFLFPALVLAFLGACASVQTAEETSVYSTMSALVALDTLATDYETRPMCGVSQATVVCADPKIVAQIKTYENTAYADLTAAMQVSRNGGIPDLTQVSLVITEFQNLIFGLQKKK